MITPVIYIIFLFGAFVRAFFGFGEALITTPLLLLVAYNLHNGIAIIGIMGLILALPGAVRNFRAIDRNLLVNLFTGSIVGVPLGLLFVHYGSLNALKWFTGIFLICYAIFNLFGFGFTKSRIKIPRFIVGFISGFLGGAINTHGAPVAIYGNLSKWSLQYTRANLQTYFAVVGFFIVIGQGVSGFWNATVLQTILLLIPGFIGISILVEWLLTKINPQKFNHLLYIFLLISGCLLFI